MSPFPHVPAQADPYVADAVSFGRAFTANPNLVDRLAWGAPLAEPDLSLAYGEYHCGYTDYTATT